MHSDSHTGTSTTTMTMALETHSNAVPPCLPLHRSLETVHDSMPGSSPSKETRVKTDRRSRVCFNFQEKIHEIDNAKLLSKNEKHKRWLSTEDFVAVKGECRRLVDEMIHSSGVPLSSYRGLEMIDPQASARRQRHTGDAVGAVLTLQREHRMKGEHNPKAIRKQYKKLGTDSMREALENAYLDKKAVQEYMSTTMQELEHEKRSEWAVGLRKCLSKSAMSTRLRGGASSRQGFTSALSFLSPKRTSSLYGHASSGQGPQTTPSLSVLSGSSSADSRELSLPLSHICKLHLCK
jgi:hypothetical protein